jgi:hypothetical protein
MEVDKWTAFPKKQPEYILQKFYGNVEYYLTYEFDEEIHMLAYIHWANNVKKDNIGLLTFKRFSNFEFIDAFAIEYCVEFFKLDNIYYIIDKK